MPDSNEWLSRIDLAIGKCLQNGELNNELIAAAMNISERQLSRKIKRLTGMSPSQYIRKYRLALANDSLKNGKFTMVKEAANAVGYLNVSYFISEFEKEFGQRPLELLKEVGWR